MPLKNFFRYVCEPLNFDESGRCVSDWRFVFHLIFPGSFLWKIFPRDFFFLTVFLTMFSVIPGGVASFVNLPQTRVRKISFKNFSSKNIKKTSKNPTRLISLKFTKNREKKVKIFKYFLASFNKSCDTWFLACSLLWLCLRFGQHSFGQFAGIEIGTFRWIYLGKYFAWR